MMVKAFPSHAETLHSRENVTKQLFGAWPINRCERGAY